MTDDTFHPFSRLPTELREEIWRFCLPHRVNEMDEPADFMVYNSFDPEDKLPCSLRFTTFNNSRPPLLTRVSRESRRVAFESGNWLSVLRARELETSHQPREDESEAANDVAYDYWQAYWQDPARESPHLNWTPAYEADLGCTINGHPLEALVREAKRVNGSASIMLGYISDNLMEQEPFDKPIVQPLESIPLLPGKQQDLAALMLLQEWLVVVRVVIMHLEFALAAKTGLFGLLGDEPVQVVDAKLPLASQLYELAESCEHEAHALTAAQDLTRMYLSDMDAIVERVALKAFHDTDLLKRMRPAIMFRLCPQMCNHANVTLCEEERNMSRDEA